MNLIVGMDFGTTNSGMAVYDGEQVKLLPLDPANTNPHVARTALYVTNDQTVVIGREAIDRYFDENVGRPVKMKKVWVGEVEVYGADMYYVTDVYAWVDVLSPGRLFLSIKSGLRDPEYQGTVVGQFYYSLENLTALYMSLAKARAERLLGQEIHQVVLGRPVHFSLDSTADALAEQRLLESAFRAKLPKHFGEGSLYGTMERRLPLPKWIYDVFSDWQTIIELQTPQSRKLLREIAQTADDRPGIEALTSLVVNSYGLQMFDVIEAAKRKLSEDMATIIRLRGPGFDVTEMVTCSEFEKIIRVEIQAIDKHLEETLATSGLEAVDIDAVIRTGGSSGIPAFRYMLVEKFGRKKVLAADTFSSVTSGLGIIAHGIATGGIEAEVHTPATHQRPGQATTSENITTVNLKLLLRRLAAQEKDLVDSTSEGHHLLLISGDGQLRLTTFENDRIDGNGTFRLPEDWSEQAPSKTRSLSPFRPNDPLLGITSRFRFLLSSAGQLSDLNELGFDVANFFQLKEEEQISAFSDWALMKKHPKLILVTTRGYARAYDLEGMIEKIEGPTPFQFDQPPPGLPFAVSGSDSNMDLVIMMASGRVVRYNVRDLRLQGIQAINRLEGDRVVGSVLAKPRDELVLVTSDGFCRRLLSENIPVPQKSNSRGRVVITRRPVAGLARLGPESQLWVSTPTRLILFSAGSLPIDNGGSTRSHRLLKLKAGESVIGVFST